MNWVQQRLLIRPRLKDDGAQCPSEGKAIQTEPIVCRDDAQVPPTRTLSITTAAAATTIAAAFKGRHREVPQALRALTSWPRRILINLTQCLTN